MSGILQDITDRKKAEDEKDRLSAHRGVLYEGVHFLQEPFSKKDLGAKVREAPCRGAVLLYGGVPPPPVVLSDWP